jgi:surface protein
MEQAAAQYNPEDAIYQPTSVQQTPVSPQPMMQQPMMQQPMMQPIQQPMMQAPTVEMQYVNKAPQQTIQPIPDEEKSNPLGLILAILILGGVGYYFYTHKDTLLPKKENPYGQTQQVEGTTQIVTAVNNCKSGGKELYINGQFEYNQVNSYYDESQEYVWRAIVSYESTSDKEFKTKFCTSIDNKPVTVVEGLFYDRKIEVLDLSSFNTSQIVVMDNMFKKTIIKELNLSGFDTSKVISMKSMFEEAEITKLNISSFTLPNDIYSLSNMFANSKIDTLILGNIELSEKQIYPMLAEATINKIVTTNKTTKENLEKYIESLREYNGIDLNTEIVDKE